MNSGIRVRNMKIYLKYKQVKLYYTALVIFIMLCDIVGWHATIA